MLISPFGRLDGEELQGAVTSFETQVMQEFANYNAQGQKASGLVGGVETVEWFFRAREPQSGIHTFNNRFLCVVFVRSDQVYRVVCSAQQGSFPETDFRSILATFEFSPR
jgi:hypothetical protein